MTRQILVIGGAGSVGKRIVRLLKNVPDTEILIAGRDLGRAQQTADDFQEQKISVRAVEMDAIGRIRPKLVIDASGPFQGRDYTIPRACIAARVAYLDIADDRDFVTGIGVLDREAIAAGVPVLSGAGMLPGLSMAAATVVAAELRNVTKVQVWFSPGNQQSFGSAACASLLAATGRRFRWLAGGEWRTARGWRRLRRAEFPMLGWRVLSPMNAPDVELLPERWPGLREATVLGAAELVPLQLGLAMLGFVPRFGKPRSGGAFNLLAEGLVRTMSHRGGQDTGLRVIVEGRDGQRDVQRSWTLLARRGDGAYLPAAPVAALTRRMLNGHAPPPGARVPLLPLHEILSELRDHDISVRMTDVSI